MSQNDMSIANQAGATFRSDLNSALQAEASLSSGATEPATMYAYQFWYDTTTSLLKIRNGANNAWVIVGPLADATKNELYVGGTKRFDIDSNGYVTITSTNAIKVPIGTTAQRPTATAGQVRFNSTNNQFEGYDGTDWVIFGGEGDKPGMMKDYAGTSLPTGYLWANGGAVSRTTYAALFAVIGTTYGVGDGSTTFNVPDRRGNTSIGVDNMGGVSAANRSQVSTTISTTSTSTAATVASATGLCAGMYVHSANVPAGTTIASISGTSITLSASATATASGTDARFSIINDPQTVGSIGGAQTNTLTTSTIPSHNHDGSTLSTNTTGAHTHTTNFYSNTYNPAKYKGVTSDADDRFSPTSSPPTTSNGDHSHTISGNTGNTGTGQPHANMQSSFVCNVIIKY